MSSARQDQERLRGLLRVVDNLPAMIAYWDEDARNVVANASYEEWFGLSPGEIRGRHISQVLGPDVYLKNLPYIQGALRGEPQLFDRTLVNQAGRTRHTLASYVPDVVDGVVRGFFVLVTDVTPRVELQRVMDEAQALAKLGSWDLVPGTSAVTWSRGVYAILGLDPSAEPLELSTLWKYIHPADRHRAQASLEEALQTGLPYQVDYRIVRPDGSAREVVGRGRPILGPDGEVAHVTGTLQDVTETNELARELARTNADLRQANDLNADVIAMLGHDIRSPLGVVRFNLELLDREWSDRDRVDGELADMSEEQRRACVSRARQASAHLVMLVDRILALSSIDSGRVSPARERIDLARAITETVDEIGLTDSVSADFGDGADAIMFDRVHLNQILTNLLTNAVRYGEAPVGISTRREVGNIAISVTDAGRGVPVDQVPQLFTRFARTGLRQAAVGGTGFGLYMARQLAEANGGTVTYHPGRDEHGHEFTLTVPAIPAIASGGMAEWVPPFAGGLDGAVHFVAP
ncbi:sensor histidine kinase [Nocardioides caricicola]|uniref:histidine kinase n=1 Tax=Nocardioides caricicola TaxID=634770 RepID=A0ABW0MXZ4_9ACTN